MPSDDESPTSDLLLFDDEEASITFTSPVARRTRSRADRDLNMATSNPIFDKDLSDILLRILQIDVTETPLHEIAEGLANDKITTWDYFLEAEMEDILAITKKSRNSERVPIGKFLMGRLKKFKLMTMEHFVTDPDTASLAVTYEAYKLSKQTRLTTKFNIPAPPVQGGQHGMTVEEKELNAWNRKKRSKESYEILLVDSMYFRWLPEFMSELAVQGLEDIVDPSPLKDPALITNPYLAELYVQQCKYLWTVLLPQPYYTHWYTC